MPGSSSLQGGAEQLSKGLTEGAAKLRAAIWLEDATGLPLTGKAAENPPPRSAAPMTQNKLQSRGAAFASGLKQASAVLQWSPGVPTAWNLPALSSAFEAMSQSSALDPKARAAGGAN